MASRQADPHSLAGPYALNALPPREAGRFERHLAACEPCAAEVRGLREAAARLAAATAVQPAPHLRERVLAEVARTRQLPPLADRPGQPGGRWPAAWRFRPGGGGGAGRRAWTRPVAVAASAAFLVVAALFGRMALVSQHNLSQAQARDHLLAAVLTAPDAKMMTVHPSGGGTATIVMSAAKRTLVFSSAGLPALPARMSYELWVMGPAGTQSAAMLPKPQHGMTSPVVAAGIRSGDRLGLTVEPSGGVPRPTSAPIMVVIVSP